MKTAISVPNSVFERVEKYAHGTGMSRSQLFAQAAEAYLGAAESASITAEINAALDSLPGSEPDAAPDESCRAGVAAGSRFLATRHFDDPADEW